MVSLLSIFFTADSGTSQRITKMEKFIFDRLQHSVDILAGRRISVGASRPSFGGLSPLMGETSPMLGGDTAEFGDLGFFSSETRSKIQKSASMLFA